MRTYLTLLLGLSTLLNITAQTIDTLYDESAKTIEKYAVLVDKNYSIEQITGDSSLLFVTNDSLRPSQAGVYWVRFKVFLPADANNRRVVNFFPTLTSTLFFFDENKRRWEADTVGLLVNHKRHSYYNQSLTLQTGVVNTLYFKTNITPLSKFPFVITPSLWVNTEKAVIDKISFRGTITAITICIVFAFFLFNAYLYFTFKDKTYFYYLLTLIGGILYMLADSKYFNVLTAWRFTQVELSKNGSIWYEDLNLHILTAAAVLIIWSFNQLTRSFLNTEKTLPKQDKILRYLSISLIILIISKLIIVAATQKMIGDLFAPVSNVLVIASVIMIVYVSFISYRQQFRAARYFLIANLISLVIILGLGIFYIVSPTHQTSFASSVALIAQSICLALALGERLLLIRDELKQKQLEAQELAAQNERIAAENRLHKTELSNFVQLLMDKTETIEKLKTELGSFNLVENQRQLIDHVSESAILTEEQWLDFKVKFENVHLHFFTRLYDRLPNVSEGEKRFFALTRLDLTNNQIAAILGISPESVIKTRYRLRKKTGEEDLEKFVISL